MTHKNTWKQRERQIAKFFGSVRTPLSGGASRHTRSDSLHEHLFVETKMRKVFAVLNLWRETKVLADEENKIPVVCLAEKGKKGFWVLCHSSDLIAISEQRKKARKNE